MKIPGVGRIGFWGLWVLLSAFAIWGVHSVPFHPDESTYLYMSGDLETYFHQPGSLAWDPGRSDDRDQSYRLLDAPLIRYVIGVGRMLTGEGPLPVDWDWSKSWSENAQAGALPDVRLLSVGRLAVTALLPLGLLFTYSTGKKLGGNLSGLLTMVLIGCSAVVLLHARRAMAEGGLLFGLLFFNYTLSLGAKRPWLTGLAAGLAFNAKFSALAILPVGLLSVLWLPKLDRHSVRKAIGNALQYVIMFAALSFLLNPVLWNQPIQAFEAAMQAREELLDRQLSDVERLAPEKALNEPLQRFAVLGAHLYLTPLMFAEVGNYLENTAQTEREYTAALGNNLFRDPLSAGLLLFFTLLGLTLSIRKVLQQNLALNRLICLLLIATFLQILAYIVAIPLPWQRYSILLVPYVTLWMGFGLSDTIKYFFRYLRRSQAVQVTE